jgi:hypothetical protein
VLYCTDTAAIGFKWGEAGKVISGRFKELRFTVKVISDTSRAITQMTGDVAGKANPYTCRDVGHERINCDAEFTGGDPWVFFRNNYTRAFLDGPPVGPPNSMDPNIATAYGTCARF